MVARPLIVAVDLIDEVSETFRVRAWYLYEGERTTRRNSFLGNGLLDSSSHSYSPSDALVNSDDDEDEDPVSSMREPISEPEVLSVLHVAKGIARYRQGAGDGEREARWVVESRSAMSRIVDGRADVDDEAGREEDGAGTSCGGVGGIST